MTSEALKTITCGLCHEVVTGSVRELNAHKAAKHPAERAAARARNKARTANRGVSINHCSSCGKFVGLETGEPEDNGIEIDDDGTVSGTVRLSLTCAECSGDMAECEVTIEDMVGLEHEDSCDSEAESFGLEIDYSLELQESGGGRFSKHLYWVTCSGTVACKLCGTDTEFSFDSEQVAASEFEPCQ